MHQATADLVKIARQHAKTLNFAIIFGAGKARIAEMLNLSTDEADELLNMYFSELPNVKKFIADVKGAAKQRGFLFNLAGRMISYPDRSKAYTGPNHIVQGGTADIFKVALNGIDEYLLNKKSKLSLVVHDEAVLNVHKSELGIVPDIQAIMENAYAYKYLPMKVEVSHSWKNMAEKKKGYPKALNQ